MLLLLLLRFLIVSVCTLDQSNEFSFLSSACHNRGVYVTHIQSPFQSRGEGLHLNLVSYANCTVHRIQCTVSIVRVDYTHTNIHSHEY